MKFESLLSAKFEALDDAVSDWSKVVGNLEKLESEARNGLRGKANKADWTGVNATVSRQFIGKTAGEFTDAHTQATSIRNILRDTRDELKASQKELKDTLQRFRSKNLTVTPTADGGFTVTKVVHPDRAASGTTVPDSTPDDTTALRDALQAVLNKATEIDDTAARLLRTLVDQTDHGFSDARYADRDAGADALKNADRLAVIAKKKPEDLTPQDFDALNTGLKKYANDDLFAERFATAVGPKGTLELWAGLNDPHRATDIWQNRRDDYGELQKNLSLTLANATQSDTRAMSQWKYDMVDLGDQQVGRTMSVSGFQVMSNLMRHGNFDDRFLNNYGTALMISEKERTSNGKHDAIGWQQPSPQFNYTGTDEGVDPVVGFMKALSSSPAAATEFFGETFLSKGEDHDFKDDKGKTAELSNFDYLFEERNWPGDTDAKGKESIAGRNYMALALEAATTGHPAGQMPTQDTPPHTAQQAALMEKLVASVSEDPKRLTDHMYMADSIGQITSEYLPDINRTTSGDVKGNIDDLFPIAGSPAVFNHSDVSRFLVTVGQSPEGYAAVQTGQSAYAGFLMEYHLDPNLPADKRYPQDPQETIEAISRRVAEVDGSLAVGRQEAILGPAGKDAKDFQDAMAQQKNMWSGAIGMGIGAGASMVATPITGALVGGAATAVTSVVLEHIFQQAETNKLQDAARDVAPLWSASRTDSIGMLQVAVQEAAEKHGLDYKNSATDWVRDPVHSGYSDASTNAAQMAQDLTTEVQKG
ncbi:hypothetical protein ACIQ9E_28375 [Streptomyces sp. NPDC094448]|uniref:hypothetical protein n=1 Tax=Streptomyces sp. NPDC094448 TaxID=3366063 RepID=UPI0037FABF0A